MNTSKARAITSTLLIITFIIVTITGIGLYKSLQGWLAKTTNWTFLGMDKEKLETLHTNTGFFMAALIIIHLALNYKMYLAELKTLKTAF